MLICSLTCFCFLSWRFGVELKVLIIICRYGSRSNSEKTWYYPLWSALAMEWSTWKWYPSSLSVGMGIYWLVTGRTCWVRAWTLESVCLDLNSSFSTNSVWPWASCLVCKMKILIILMSVMLKHFLTHSKRSGYFR